MILDRIKTITYTFYLIFALIIVRLFFIQILSHQQLSSQVIKQTYKTVELPPNKGNITDSFGKNIAYNKTYYTASLYKPNIKNLDEIISKLENEQDSETLKKFANNDSQKWITLKHNFEKDFVDNNISDEISFTPISLRQYFNYNIYAPIINGIEGYYQKSLTGRFGFGYQNQDAVGNPIFSDRNWILPPVHGQNIQTSINPIIQNLSYTTLKNGVEKFAAQAGSIIVMDSALGKIISMVSLESTSSATVSKNRIISDLYEPGSIFKPLVLASALDSESISSSWVCSQCHSPRSIGQFTIENWDKNTHPNSDIKDIIKNSDNIGMSYIISQMGKDKFLPYFSSLGIDNKTGIDLKGEVKPPIKKYWPDIDFATASFGQGFSLTQIQMITAFNSLASRGVYKKPYLATSPSNQGQQIFKPQTVAQIDEILRYSVKNSPVSSLNIKNLDICGKSGTAQVAESGAYSETNFVASYIGYFPCSNPKVTILVTLNHPQTSAWGSSTAAPIWFELAQLIDPLL